MTISKIRFLESQGLVDPERTPSGYRKFYDHDVERLRWILRQQRENFLPLKIIRGRLTEQADEFDETGPEGGDPDAGRSRGGARRRPHAADTRRPGPAVAGPAEDRRHPPRNGLARRGQPAAPPTSSWRRPPRPPLPRPDPAGRLRSPATQRLHRSTARRRGHGRCHGRPGRAAGLRIPPAARSRAPARGRRPEPTDRRRRVGRPPGTRQDPDRRVRPAWPRPAQLAAGRRRRDAQRRGARPAPQEGTRGHGRPSCNSTG